MKKMLLILAAGGCAGAFGAVTTVGAGETLTITDATAANYADGLAFADATGVVEFDTASAPTMDIAGAGTVKKTSSADWTMAKAIPDFTGNYDLAGAGAVSFNFRYAFGADSSADCKLYVRNGATLSFKTYAAARLWDRTVCAAGRGKDDRGAIELVDTASDTSGRQFSNLTLDADTLVKMPNGGLMFVNYSNGIDLNGHNLHLAGKGTFTYLKTLKGTGDVVLEGTASAKPVWGIREGGGNFDSTAKQSFRMNGNAQIQVIGHTTPKISVPLYLTGTGNSIQYNEYWNSTLDWTTNGVGWAGPITFTNEPGTAADLSFASAGSPATNKQFTVTGRISGPGAVKTGDYHNHRVCFAATNNAWTGGTYFSGNGSPYVSAVLLHPGSVPDYSSVTGYYGRVYLCCSPDLDEPWTSADVARFASQARFMGDAAPLLDVAGVTNGVPNVPLTVTTGCVTLAANGLVDLTGTTARGFPTNFTWSSGTALFTGPQCFTTDVFKVKNGSALELGATPVFVKRAATVVMDGGVEFATGTNSFFVGDGSVDAGYLRDETARLVVSNAFLHTISTNVNCMRGGENSLTVGGMVEHTAGILDVCAGAVVSNKIVVGGGGDGAGTGGGRGLVIQRAGSTVYALGSLPNDHFGAGVGVAGHGAYEMLGGTFTAYGSFMIGGYSSGVWRQFGGTAVFTNYPGVKGEAFGAGKSNGGWGTIDLRGGAFRIGSGEFFLANGWTQADQKAVVNVEGEGTFMGGPSATWKASGNSLSNESTVVVRNGAVLQAKVFINKKDGIQTLAFDRGTLRPGQNHYCLFGAADSYNQHIWTFVPANVPRAVLVYAGGLTLDTAGYAEGFSNFPITAPQGGGVTGTSFGDEIVDGDMSTIPTVTIAGDGFGAAAVAEYDVERGAVTGIRVVCPGTGYTYATASVSVHRGATNMGGKAYEFACTIAPNAQTGGFTKTGAGDFTLNATNTWGGALTVSGGTLKCGCEKAIPDDRALTLAGGGVLDLNGTAVKIASVTYGVGGGSIANASAATIPAAFGITLSVDDMLADRTVTFTGDVDLSSATVTLTGEVPSTLDPETRRRYDLATTTGAFSGTPAYVSGTLPPNWRFAVRGKTVSLVHATGFAVLIR